MNQLTESFTLSFPGPTQPNFAISKSFHFAGSEWLAGLYPSERLSPVREDVVICLQQRGGTACSAANTYIEYSITGMHTFGVRLNYSGNCTLWYDRAWRTEQFNATKLTHDIVVKLTMTRSVYNIASGTLADDQTSFGENSETSDVDIKASDGTSIPAHKCFLMMRSYVFRTMFSTAMSESITNTITIDDVEPAAVRSFVRFTYTDQLNPCCVSLCMQLYRMAHKYEVRGLKLQCTQYLHNQLSDENVIDILSLGQFYNATDLSDSALYYISQHAAAFTSNAGFARRVSVYLADYLSSAITGASPSTMVTDSSTSDTSANTFPTTSNPTTANTTDSTTATTATTNATTNTPDMVLLSALAGIAPGINQFPHLTLTIGDAGPLLYKCEHCSGR